MVCSWLIKESGEAGASNNDDGESRGRKSSINLNEPLNREVELRATNRNENVMVGGESMEDVEDPPLKGITKIPSQSSVGRKSSEVVVVPDVVVPAPPSKRQSRRSTQKGGDEVLLAPEIEMKDPTTWESWGPKDGKQAKWGGHFMQDGTKNEMDIDNLQIGFDGGIHGNGSDGIGEFKVDGTVSRDGAVQFTKKYDSHNVNYEGTLSKGAISGEWHLDGGDKDSFELSIAPENWTGSFEQDGKSNAMDLCMSFDPNGLFGTGSDSVGNFVLRGSLDTDANRVDFVKKYLGQHEVLYSGLADKDASGSLVIQGKWQIAGSGTGTFKLTKA